jgi:hypothetical protein
MNNANNSVIIDGKKGTYYRLTFKRRPKLFPQINDLVLVKQNELKLHLMGVNAARDADLINQYPILNKFLQQQGNNADLFYETEIEQDFGVVGEIPLQLVDIIPSNKKEPMLAKLALTMFDFPADVDPEDRFLYYNINDLTVVEPKLCNLDIFLSEDAPDNNETFGFFDKKLDVYRVFQNAGFESEDLVPLLCELGLKEYSKIIKFEPITDEDKVEDFTPPDEEFEMPNNYLDTLDKNEIATNPMAPGKEYVDAIKSNPLYSYTKRLFIGLVNTMVQNGIQCTPEQVNELYFNIFDVMLRTGVPFSTKITLSPEDLAMIKKVPD